MPLPVTLSFCRQGLHCSTALPAADIDEVTGNRGCRSHLRADQVRAAALALPALEVAVRCGGTAFAGFKRVWIQLVPADTRTSREYHDANDANNSAEIFGEELVRRLAL